MVIIPAIDIRGGKCVRLVQGDYHRETVFGEDPVAMALQWVGQGARRLHVVDLDAARDGEPVNEAIVRRIVEEAGVPVQVAGGVRTIDDVARWADGGADRVVVGTAAVEDPAMVEGATAKYREQVAVSIDARGGKPAIKGWLETSDVTVKDFMREMAGVGVRHFIFTDIDRDGMMESVNIDLVQPLVDLLRDAGLADRDEPAPLIFGGGVTSVEDIESLARFDIEGVITGRALYDGRIDLRAAQRALAMGDDW
jgi:phosphoribosylformimino-5-aminoimidazole carboxamide ribotide isomerase